MKYYNSLDTLTGVDLLEHPLLNKSTAFTEKERVKFNLHGLIPLKIETIEEQLARTDWSYNNLTDPMAKHIFLRALQDMNETLFYRYLLDHPVETLPIIYTPTVGSACQEFSKIYRRPRGIFLSYPERKHIPQLLAYIKQHREIKITVMTDGERILGLGDQGVGGLGIPIGKLSLYSLLAGIHPAKTLPIILDVGTNNQERLSSNDYLGWRHERLTGQKYLDFVDECIGHLVTTFPDILIQFEDFAQNNAHQLLDIYKDKICCFNDDIQGTAAVAGATLLSAIKRLRLPINEIKIAVYGAGSAGCGIAALIKNIAKNLNMAEEKLQRMFYMVDKNGLLHDGMDNIKAFEKPFLQSTADLKPLFDINKPISLEQVIDKIQPIALIGVSGQFGHFTENIVRKMASYTAHPIIFPLSNPNEKCEATPQDILNWTNGKAIIATGSPFGTPAFKQKNYTIAQCNNAYIFPAMGLSIIAGKMKRVPSNLFEVAALTLAKHCPEGQNEQQSLLPCVKDIRAISKIIAHDVIKQGIESGCSELKNDSSTINQAIEAEMWYPQYW